MVGVNLRPPTWCASSAFGDVFADPCLKQGDGDRPARAACSDEEYPRSLRLGSMVFLRLHEGESVEHVAVPGPVRIAADDAHDPEHLGALGAGGAEAKAVNLCGMVTRIPSTFREAVRPAMTASRSSAGTCKGTHMPL